MGWVETWPRWHSVFRQRLNLLLQGGVILVLLLLLVNTSVLVLLVLRDQVVHVGLSLSELHLVHTLASVPMQESLTTEHGSELLTDTLEELLDGGRVTDKGGGHLEAAGRNRAEGGLDIVGDPLDEVGRVLVLDVAHLVLDVLHGDLTTEDGRAGQVATVAEVRGSHHVLGVEHLLSELRNADSAERVGATAGQGSESDHEEVKTGEGNHVDGQLTQVRVQLTRETQAGGNTGHDGRDEMVQVAVRGVRELESTHADVVESLVINAEGFIGVLNQLVDGESGVVGLNNGVGNLRGGNDGKGRHHAVGELLANLGDQQSTHTSTSTSTKGVGDLETLKAVAALSLAADDVKDLVDKLSSFGVVTLGPVVAGTGLAKDEVVGAKKLAEGTGADGIHGAGLQVDEDGARDILVAGSFVEVDAHALELELRGAIVNAIAVEAVLARDVLPKGSTNLVTALAGLEVNNLTHCG